MYFIRKIFCLLGLFCLNTAVAQDNFTGYFEPRIAVNYKVTDNYSHNLSLSLRNYMYGENELQLDARQLEIVHFSKLKIDNNQSIALGIQYRFRNTFEPEKENKLRLTQQYNITDKPKVIRFGHRFRAEQRITKSLTTHRFRYRFALDFPLKGEQLDLGEPYFVASTESLLSVAKKKGPQYDQRLSINIGWLLNKMTKLQGGVEYSIENYTGQGENVLFLLTSLVLNL